ncbi:MAG TPA: response regulator [Bacteroidales bacterium]|nr:response regulator [Bacteroidales bacterium]
MNLHELKNKEAGVDEEIHWAGKVILVAEDVELNFMYINELLEPTGAIIVRAENGKKAVDYCAGNAKVDMVLMDILMPVMNGYEATKQIKAMRKDIPIIAQTAYALTEDRGKAIAAGCDDFIAKPIGREELLRKINAFFKANTF